MSSHDDDQELVTVRLTGIPVGLHAEAEQHQDDLKREFALMAEGSQPDDVPPRLLALTQELKGRFDSFSSGPMAELDHAIERGNTTIDLEFKVPAQAGEAAEKLGALLEEADAFCAAGDLLTLATPGRLVTYRRWFLDEFVNQISGKAPTAWEDYASRP